MFKTTGAERGLEFRAEKRIRFRNLKRSLSKNNLKASRQVLITYMSAEAAFGNQAIPQLLDAFPPQSLTQSRFEGQLESLQYLCISWSSEIGGEGGASGLVTVDAVRAARLDLWATLT